MNIHGFTKGTFLFLGAIVAAAFALAGCGSSSSSSLNSPNNTPDSTSNVPAYSMTGQIDTSFANNGFTTTPQGNSDVAVAVGQQSSGDILLAYYNSTTSSNPITTTTTTYYVARFSASGILDTTFGTAGKFTACTSTSIFGFGSGCTISGITVQGDDKIILTVNQAGFFTESEFTRYSAGGALDTTYNTTGTTLPVFGSVTAAVIDPTSGDLVAAGTLAGLGSFGAFVTRITSTGVGDATFGTSGTLIVTSLPGFTGTPSFTAGALNPINDEYLVSGSVGSNLLTGEISSMGILDTGFETSGVDSVSGLTAIYGMAVQSDGSILLAGPASTGLKIMRLLSSGQVDTSYGTGGSFTLPFTAPHSATLKKLLIDGNDEALLIANTSTTVPTPTNGAEIVRVTTTGAQDSTFANGALSLSAGTTIAGAVLPSSGELILAISGSTGAQLTEIK